MALSPNYGWSEPDNSSLVKNGAADIRTLGDAIDTSLWNVGFGQAGKNKILNSDFNINQRNFTTSTTSGAYTFDRWSSYFADGTVTYSAQTFTPGAAPVAGYESKNFLRCAVSGQTLTTAANLLIQNMEDVRLFAGQTVTVSFWAKAATGAPKVGIELYQAFSTGGGASSPVSIPAGAVTLSTSWARYSVTVAVPSLAGKTIGTDGGGTGNALSLNLWTSAGSTFATRASSIGIQSATIDFWGIQIEAGSYATPFQTATGTIQGELAACQRYYYRAGSNTGNAYAYVMQGTVTSSTQVKGFVTLPTAMRVNPTLTRSGSYQTNGGQAVTSSAIDMNTISGTATTGQGIIIGVASGLTTGQSAFIFANNDASAYFAWDAEL